MKMLVDKTYHSIKFNSVYIDRQISLVFRDFNELSLIHESKLGHALKDMQQFLEYYQSSDEIVHSILSKLDMIISQQEKRMYIEIFGENPIECNTISKHVKGSSYLNNQPQVQQQLKKGFSEDFKHIKLNRTKSSEKMV